MAATPTWSTNQSAGLWDVSTSQINFDETKHEPKGHTSKSSCGDSNDDSPGIFTSHGWVSGSESSDDSEAQDDRCNLVDRVAQLIARMLDDDERFEPENLSNNNPAETEDAADGKDGSASEPSSKTDDLDSLSSSPREKFLEKKLAQVFIELSAEQENLHFAASAGKELLEQLGELNDDNHKLCSQLHACQQQLKLAELENAHAQQQQSAMEHELMQIHESWSELQPKSNNSSRGRGDNPPWLVSATVKEVDRGSCQLCPGRNADLKSVLEENNVLKRHCLELESQQNKQRVELEKLQHKHDSLQATTKTLVARCDQSEREVQDTNVQLKQLKLDHQDAAASRDNLRVTAWRLQNDNDNLVQKLVDRDLLIKCLRSEKQATATTAQILENRVSNLQLENQTLMLTLAESHQRQREVEQLQQLHGIDANDQCSEGTISLQQHARDLEILLDEAQRALVSLKLENKMHRRHRQPHPDGIHAVTATFRRAKSLTISCADIFAADEAILQLQSVEINGTAHDQLQPSEDASSSLTRYQTQLAQSEAATVLGIQVAAIVDLDAAPAPLSQGVTPTFLQSVATRRRHTYADNNGETQSIREQERMRRSTVTTSGELLDTTHDQTASATSPLYLGLSVIACATAAAGILSRRQ